MIKEYSFDIEHSLSNGVFKPRGRVTLTIKPDGKQTVQLSGKNGMAGEDVVDFKNLILEEQLYQIRMRMADSSSKADFVLASIPAVTSLLYNATSKQHPRHTNRFNVCAY